MMKKWLIKEQDEKEVRNLAASAGITPFAAKLLINRGIKTMEQADVFFNSEEISDPFEIADMDKAAAAVNEAMESGDKITVYGDYDCDGITATAILYGYLEAMGADADWYIPSREEGYGLNKTAIDKIAAGGTRLIVTVDNGISAVEEALYIEEKGMELVITDHHQVPEVMPKAKAVVDPHRSDDMSDCKELAGCGVALKLVMALENDVEMPLEEYGDLAAIGTVGDLVPLTGENRILVRKGLEILPMTERGGLYQLLKKSGISIEEEGEITSSTLAFALCPRINAAGRLAHPKEAEKLFLSDNPAEYNALAENLCKLNTDRKEEENRIIEEIDKMIAASPKIVRQRVIVVSGKNWNHGIIGIVASRLLNRWGKPVLVITEEGENARGSARSVEGFSLFKMLSELKDMLVKFGGHTKAAGFTLESGRIVEFTEAVYSYARENFPQMPKDFCEAEMTVSGGDLSLANMESLSYFQPFGEGNPSPQFCIKNCLIKSLRPLKEGKYLSFGINIEGEDFTVLDFMDSFGAFPFREGDTADLMVTAEVNEYNGSRSVKLKLLDIRYSNFDQDRFFAAENAYEKLCLGEEIPVSLSKRIIPDRGTQMAVYDIVRKSGADGSITRCADAAGQSGINYCMFRVTLDLLGSVGLVAVDLAKDSVKIIPNAPKADLENSRYMNWIRKRIGSA